MIDYGEYGSNNEFVIPQSDLLSQYSIWHKEFGIKHPWFKRAYCTDLDLVEGFGTQIDRLWAEVNFTNSDVIRFYDLKKAEVAFEKGRPVYYRKDAVTPTQEQAYKYLNGLKDEFGGGPIVYIVYTTLGIPQEGGSKWWVFDVLSAVKMAESHALLSNKPLTELKYATLLMNHRGVYGTFS